MELHPRAAPLEHLSDAVAVSARLTELADHLVGHFVDRARGDGASWTDIGRHLGVSKQAAQKRFVPKASDGLDAPVSSSFTRFTPRARHVVDAAMEEARARGHAQLDTGHLLIGLLGEDEGLTARAIDALASASPAALREAAGLALGPADSARPHRVRYSPAAKKTLQLALREALHLGHHHIGTEHILLGLLRTDDDPAARLLIGAGVTRKAAGEWLRTAAED